MCSIKMQTENSRENTNAPHALPISNALVFQASRGVHNKNNAEHIFPQDESLYVVIQNE